MIKHARATTTAFAVVLCTVLAGASLAPGASAAKKKPKAPSTVDLPAIEQMVFNVTSSPVVSGAQVRLGLSLALDRPALARLLKHDSGLVKGSRTIPVSGVIAPGIPGFAKIDRAADGYFKPTTGPQTAAAQQALAAGGYVAGTPVRIMYSGGSNSAAITAEVGKDLEAVGVTVAIEKVSAKTLFADSGMKSKRGAADIYMIGWGTDYLRADDYFQQYLCKSDQNSSGYCDPAFDRLFRASIGTRNAARQLADFVAMDGMLVGPSAANPVATFGSELQVVPASVLEAPPALPATCPICEK